MAAQPGCGAGGIPGHPGLRCSRPLCVRLTTAGVACKCSHTLNYRAQQGEGPQAVGHEVHKSMDGSDRSDET